MHVGRRNLEEARDRESSKAYRTASGAPRIWLRKLLSTHWEIYAPTTPRNLKQVYQSGQAPEASAERRADIPFAPD